MNIITILGFSVCRWMCVCGNVISNNSSDRHFKIFLGVSGAYGWSCGLAHGLVLFQGVSYVESRACAAYSLAT